MHATKILFNKRNRLFMRICNRRILFSIHANIIIFNKRSWLLRAYSVSGFCLMCILLKQKCLCAYVTKILFNKRLLCEYISRVLILFGFSIIVKLFDL